MNKASGSCGIISKLGMMSGTLQEGREEIQRQGKLWRNHGWQFPKFSKRHKFIDPEAQRTQDKTNSRKWLPDTSQSRCCDTEDMEATRGQRRESACQTAGQAAAGASSPRPGGGLYQHRQSKTFLGKSKRRELLGSGPTLWKCPRWVFQTEGIR